MASVEFERFKKLLKQNGNFITAPRMRLFGVLQNHPALTTIQLIKQIERHDRATVYRNLDLFEKLGIITQLRIGWETKIELSDIFHHHHHHLTCMKCGKVTVLKENRAVEQQIANMTRQLNFKPLDHQLEIRGLCKNCQTTAK